MNDAEHSCPSVIRGSMLEEHSIISDLLTTGVRHPQVLLWQYDTAAIIMGCSQRPDEGQLQRAEQSTLKRAKSCVMILCWKDSSLRIKSLSVA